jgi:FkbM family methyltransferase
MKRRGGLGWLPEFLSSETSPEQRFWLNCDLSGLVVYDIGAFHGLFTLLFAQTARQVISYEPSAENYARLAGNVELNRLHHVTLRNVGLGDNRETATMLSSRLLPGAAHIGAEATGGSKMRSERVSITTLDEDIREMNFPPPGFIKIDVEGAELAVLSGARNTLLASRPQLFLEIHGATLESKQENVAAVVGYLHEMGYQHMRHIESGMEVDTSNSAVAAQGHLHCA